MATIDRSIQFLQQFARDALNRAERLSARIPVGGGLNLQSPRFRHTVRRPNMTAPRFTDLVELPDTSEESLRRLDNEVEKWVDKYFPELNACLKSTPEEWLCGIITGQKPLGMSREAFEAVWHEGRDRAYRQAHTEKAQVRAEFSERGFSIPPGAMLGAIADAEVRASDAIAEVNRQQTNRDAEIKLDLLKFAEEQAIRLKLGVMDALARFYTQWAQLPDRDIERQRVRAQMYASLQSALSAYYNVELGFEELRMRAARGSADVDIAGQSNVVSAYGRTNPGEAIAAAVRGFSDIAASTANAQSSFAAEVLSGSAP